MEGMRFVHFECQISQHTVGRLTDVFSGFCGWVYYRWSICTICYQKLWWKLARLSYGAIRRSSSSAGYFPVLCYDLHLFSFLWKLLKCEKVVKRPMACCLKPPVQSSWDDTVWQRLGTTKPLFLALWTKANQNHLKHMEQSFFFYNDYCCFSASVNASVNSEQDDIWCSHYFAFSHKKKRMNQIKKMMQRGLLDPEKDDPFSLFVASTNIRYCYYADTHKILGNTFGMCVLQVRVSYLRHPSHFWGLYSTSHSSRLLRDVQLQFV